MPQELAYVIITPYTLSKSRTGGVIARLMARTGLDLAAARMFAPSQELVERYADNVVSATDPQDRLIQELIRQYVLKNFVPDPKTGLRRRVMVLLFEGEDAVRKMHLVVGNFSAERRTGETIRDTYGDLVLDESGKLQYFEPAVLAAPDSNGARQKLQIWSDYSDKDGGLLENTIAYRPGEMPQRTLVLLKPENFRIPSGRPGNMIDYFSRAGLFIVGLKVHRMTVAQACEFYGTVHEYLRTKLKDVVGNRAKTVIEKEFGFPLGAADVQKLGEALSPAFGDNQFDNIIRFMAGKSPGETDPSEMDQPGSEKCIALVYEGVDAVRKIRDILGPTDPSKAPPGSIRREFGQSIMINAAHASDAPESAVREMAIVKPGENNFKKVVELYLKG